MIEDFRAIPSVEPLEADICIIGAGPSGLALAHELAATTRLNIILLESGGLGIEPAAQALSEGIRNKGIMHRGLGPAGRGRAFGGSGRLWAGQCLPLDPIDLAADLTMASTTVSLRRLLPPHSNPPSASCTLSPIDGPAAGGGAAGVGPGTALSLRTGVRVAVRPFKVS